MASTRPVIDLPIEGELPSLSGAAEWLNSPALTAAGLRGNVVVVDFCTYTCINWLRSLPYVRAWAEKYNDRGLVMIGVHTPEFSFEHNPQNVRQVLSEMRVAYPIAIEGDYERSEVVIQHLLIEAGVADIGRELVSVDAQGPEAAADWDSLESPETYLGYQQTQNFASPGGLTPNKRHVYASHASLRRNHWSLSGDWTVGAEAAVLNEPSGRIAFQLHARDVHLVMGPQTRDESVRFRVFIDGSPPGAGCGSDVDADGSGILIEQRMYQLIRQPGTIVDRVFEI